MANKVIVIGAGLAGSEAAHYLAKKGFEVHLYERRPLISDGAHESDLFGELVCSNSLKSFKLDNACGLLKEEMKELGSLMIEAAYASRVPSGNALSVDRELFAKYITDKLLSFNNIIVHREEVNELGDEPIIVATGPLTNGRLLEEISSIVGKKGLSFFDASAPIVKKESLDFTKVYYKSRFEQDDASYLNCPFSKEEYFAFVNELISAKKALIHEFDTKYFEGCLPIEVIASRGVETLRHGPLKPFGLGTEEHPKPYAVVQLRQDTKLGDCYNLVGFQTNLTYDEQKRVFRMIPGLDNAEFVRFGLMHRNTYLDSPSSLNEDLSLKNKDNVFIAGQLSGVEGYVESAAMGIVAAINIERKLKKKPFLTVPKETVLGSLIDYVLHSQSGYFAPMNANWALFPDSKKGNRESTIERSLLAIKLYREEKDE